MNDEIGFTVEENDLLNRMAAGEFDGFVGDPLMTKKGVCFWLVIQDNYPMCYLELPTRKEFVNGEIKRSLGTMLSVKSWMTDEEKLEFLRENGDQIDDAALRAYISREKKAKSGLFADWKENAGRVGFIYPFEILPLQ